MTAIYQSLYREGPLFGMAGVLPRGAAHLAATNRAFIGQEGYERLWTLKIGD